MTDHESFESIIPCETIMRELCKNSHDAIIVIDSSDIILSMNGQAEILFDYDLEAVFKENLRLILPEYEPNLIQQNLIATAKDSSKLLIQITKIGFSREGESLFFCVLRDLRHESQTENPRQPLTARQNQILKLVAEGQTSREIADNLKISIKTVETHRANIMSKLGAKNVSALVRFAVEHGII